ncbi:MAG: hypothetical protein ACKPJO_29735 [Dolichospermum sp.]
MFVSTVVAAVPYYFYLSKSHFVHSASVFDCCLAAGLSWSWNWDALAQIALFDHVLGNESLHSAIFRVPQASIVEVYDGKKQIETEPFWTELYKSKNITADLSNASSVLIDILSELPVNENYSLSLSAGYDSRALLACMAFLNRNVALASMGKINSTDPRIAGQLAQSVGYNFRRIEIVPDDYVHYASDILKTTSGEKTFWHWHTGIYTKKVEFDPTAIHLVGSNGEFARSYFFDKGIVAETIDKVGFSRWDYWLGLKNSVKRRMASNLKNAMNPQSLFLSRLNSTLQLKRSFIPGMRFGDGLDNFYASERVRNFIGLGLALFRSKYTTFSPFLDARFIRYTAMARRYDKLANRMHKAVIGQLRPELLNFPTDESGTPMHSDSGYLYFLKHGQMIGYNCYKDALKIPEVKNWARLGFCELGGNEKLLDFDKANLEQKGWQLFMTIGAVSECLQKNGIQKA